MCSFGRMTLTLKVCPLRVLRSRAQSGSRGCTQTEQGIHNPISREIPLESPQHILLISSLDTIHEPTGLQRDPLVCSRPWPLDASARQGFQRSSGHTLPDMLRRVSSVQPFINASSATSLPPHSPPATCRCLCPQPGWHLTTPSLVDSAVVSF